MPSTADLFNQALQQFQRGGQTPGAVAALGAFDPTAALKEYGAAAGGQFTTALNQQLRGLKGSAAGAGRLRTGFYDTDAGQLTQNLAQQYQQDLASQALGAAGLKENALATAGGIEEAEQGRYLELLTGQLDREQAAKNARSAQTGAILGGVGEGLGTGAGLLLSDRRLKRNISPIEDASDQVGDLSTGGGRDGGMETEPAAGGSASDRLAAMPAYNFNYAGDDEPQQGVMAQDVAQAEPSAVSRLGAGGGPNAGDQPLMVNYLKLIPLLIEATREQGEELARLRARFGGQPKSYLEMPEQGDEGPAMTGAAA